MDMPQADTKKAVTYKNNLEDIIEQKNNEIHRLQTIIKSIPVDIYWNPNNGFFYLKCY